MCECSLEPENTSHFLLHCHNYDILRLTLMSNLNRIDSSLSFLNDTNLVRVLLFGDKKYDLLTNQKILKVTIDFLKESGRFEEALF